MFAVFISFICFFTFSQKQAEIEDDFLGSICQVIFFIFSKDYWWFDNKNISNNDDHTKEHSKACERPLEQDPVQEDAKNRGHEAEDNEISYGHVWYGCQKRKAHRRDEESISGQ